MSESESNSESRVKAVLNDDLLAVLAPVLDWYQSDEHPEREPLDILRDIVADLQSDRADSLALRAQIGKPPEGSHPDEQYPRSQTWHEERRAWTMESERQKTLLANYRRLVGKLAEARDKDSAWRIAKSRAPDDFWRSIGFDLESESQQQRFLFD